MGANCNYPLLDLAEDMEKILNRLSAATLEHRSLFIEFYQTYKKALVNMGGTTAELAREVFHGNRISRMEFVLGLELLDRWEREFARNEVFPKSNVINKEQLETLIKNISIVAVKILDILAERDMIINSQKDTENLDNEEVIFITSQKASHGNNQNLAYSSCCKKP